jgi:hypothetical protein
MWHRRLLVLLGNGAGRPELVLSLVLSVMWQLYALHNCVTIVEEEAEAAGDVASAGAGAVRRRRRQC